MARRDSEVSEIDEWEAAARRTIGDIHAALKQVGLQWVDLVPPALLGLGLAVGWSNDRYCVISVGLGGSEDMVSISSGVLRGVHQDRLQVLDACNTITRDNATFPCFLHDAEVGWDVLICQRFPIGVLANNVSFFKLCLEVQPIVSENIRSHPAFSSLGGVPYTWSDDDVNQLLIRSLI
jgi:hypothetical protein